MKYGYTNNVWVIRTHNSSTDADKPTEYGINQLMELAKNSTNDTQVPVWFDITKFHKNTNGDVQTVTGATVGLMSVIPVGTTYTSKDGGEILIWAWTSEDVTQPGGNIVCTLTDEFGTVQMDGTNEKKEPVTTGIKKRSLVLIRFKEGDQNGEVVLTITKDWCIIFASTQEDAPFAGSTNFRPSLWSLLMRILPSVPTAMAGTVDDATISQVP